MCYRVIWCTDEDITIGNTFIKFYKNPYDASRKVDELFNSGVYYHIQAEEVELDKCPP